ncbi:MAG: glycoside hydrolase family 43 protein [Gemmatimonadetes bacterium]|nr:glycoside hydrolase family 43 protein [Gemmatimonadota bacterium]
MLTVMTGMAMAVTADVSPATRPAEGPWLFTSFRGNGEDGLYLAYSRDGYAWTPLNGDKPVLKPAVGGEKLMRDPCIQQGPDGTFHMVWTTGWKEEGFGYANSKDLIHWSEQRFVPVTRGALAEGVYNTWAPELFFDDEQRRFLIVWSSTRRSQAEKDHRMYVMTTRDFRAFSEPALLLDPGYPCIDGTILREDRRYVLFFKDEREGQKVIRVAKADRPEGPYGPPSDPLQGDGVEGPSAMRIGRDVIVYFDHYRSPQHYGAFRSRDLEPWEDITSKVSFPDGHRHGSILRVSEEQLAKLLGAYSGK